MVANNISPIQISESKEEILDTYNQIAKKAQMQIASGTTEIVTPLENSLHLSSLRLTLCQFYSFKLAYSCQQGHGTGNSEFTSLPGLPPVVEKKVLSPNCLKNLVKP